MKIGDWIAHRGCGWLNFTWNSFYVKYVVESFIVVPFLLIPIILDSNFRLEKCSHLGAIRLESQTIRRYFKKHLLGSWFILDTFSTKFLFLKRFHSFLLMTKYEHNLREYLSKETPYDNVFPVKIYLFFFRLLNE